MGGGQELHGFKRLISCPTAFRIWMRRSQTHSVFEKSAIGPLVGRMTVQGSWAGERARVSAHSSNIR